MEQNKQVAIHAKEIAEKRLLKQDYAGAKAMALKAKKLLPPENLSQLLAVCEVHCSAQLMANGLYDWYKIIQVEPLSDEIMIKKQYHKLVALLHPDKNKIPGAEAAFKLVVEANNTLSDRAKRIMYDFKRKHLVRSAGPHESTETNAAHNSSSNFNKANKWKPHQRFTFWAECPGCETRHQYNCNILSHIVCCTNCSKNFIANTVPHLNAGLIDGGRSPQQTETNAAHNSSSNLNRVNKWKTQQQPQPQPNQQFTFWTKCPGCEYRHQYHCNFLSREVCCRHCSKNFVANALPHHPGLIDVGWSPEQITETNSAHNSSGNLNSANKCWAQQQHQPQPHLGLTFRTECTNCGTMLQYHSNISYQIVCCTHCFKSFSASAASHLEEQVEPSGLLENINTDFKSSGSAEDNGATSKKARVGVNGVPNGNGSANATNTNTSASTCVEGEVKKQDREREKDSEQVEPSGLLKEMDTTFERSESAEENSVTYKKARVEVNGVPDGNGSASATNIDTSASTCTEGEVEEHDSVKEKAKEQVEPTGLLKQTDTAFEPSGYAQDKGSISRVAKVGTSMVRCESSQPNADAEYLYKHPDAECLYEHPDAEYMYEHPDAVYMYEHPDEEYLYEHPDAEFHNFNICRTCNNFQEGNIWALYSDLDTYPKYYGLVCKVEHEPFNVHVNWLKACPESDVERAWLGENLPISCGKFRVTAQNMTYDKPDFFSHMVSARHHVRGNYYDIMPGVGEVWAVYKNWSAGWTLHDFRTCKFDIVEIREQREDSTVVCPLSQVPGFKSVFMPEQVDGTGSCTWEVPESEYILFSHKIPCIRLTEECEGKLKGFWELDPASVPYTFFYDDK
ncbi:DNAJ heat shock N-terminal domain-containing protein-like [Rhynchospora pubera]|uniref:DNAJ heat shock N-terminal domain-containing protein-like n=2 Tax=Rhynchospora pubera TaxID=906938 RepID=A0AAV8H9Y1_9POAL|nr:DNAJ heat shock N-terminal domain-containing protein-like [Rhynchospora pubera]